MVRTLPSKQWAADLDGMADGMVGFITCLPSRVVGRMHLLPLGDQSEARQCVEILAADQCPHFASIAVLNTSTAATPPSPGQLFNESGD